MEHVLIICVDMFVCRQGVSTMFFINPSSSPKMPDLIILSPSENNSIVPIVMLTRDRLLFREVNQILETTAL